MDGRTAMDAPATEPPVVEPPAGSDAPPAVRPRRQWWPVIVGTGLALLLVGAAVGLVLGRSAAGVVAVPAADSVDVGFAQDMSVHHEQAVEMAAWERDHTKDPRLQQLAFDIESTQTSQTGRMQGWLESWGAAALPTGGYMGWMAGEAGHSHGTGVAGAPTTGKVAAMPGMASEDELKRLRSSTGPTLDVLFLQLMLRHHEGAAGMLRYAADHAGRDEVRNLASQMLTAQTGEAAYLRQLLAERGAQPLPS
jgi:uncharacterized protein (DUF305 family)